MGLNFFLICEFAIPRFNENIEFINFNRLFYNFNLMSYTRQFL